jgi:multiple sugar transport system permease protein
MAAFVLVVVPLLMTVVMAFTEYNALESPRWTGGSNFTRMFSDPLFRTALWNSLIFVAIAVPLRLLAATAASLLFAQRRRGARTGRALTYLPSVIPDISFALLWLWIFNPIYGPIAGALRAMGLPASALLLDPWGARAAVIVMTTFQIGEGFVIALAARNDIPNELYELSALEGASAMQTMRRVTLPVLAPVLVLLAARDIAFSFQVNFVPAFVLTEGGPYYATTFLPLYTYQNAFEYLRFGYAAAMTVTMFAVSAALIATHLVFFRRRFR